jgi:hypothetical protein
MSGRIAARAVACALAAVTTAGVITTAASPASATAAQLPGSVLYDKNSNIYATDGVGTRQITTDGATPAADGTGSSGYLVPSESDDGSVVVAVRNQQRTSADQQTYYRGYLWVLDAYGHVVRKINPPQYAYDGGTTCNMPANSPQGIFNAQVSPDGEHIAYTIRELIEVWGVYGCYVDTSYRTTVIDIDGTNPVAIDDGSGQITAAEDLEIGSWVSNSSLLVDRLSFGSVQVYTVTLPGPAATAWFGPSSYTDAAYSQPDARAGVLVSAGYSDAAMTDVVRLWSSSGYASSPTYRCEVGSAVDAGDAMGDPSLAPDGTLVAYQDTNSDGTVGTAGQGVYVMATANNTCGSPQLLVAGATDAYWSPAGLTPPPSVVLGSHPADPTNATSASIGFTVYHSGAAPTVTCRLDDGPATGCSSPVAYALLANGVHTVTITASDGVHAGSAGYSWRVDTSKPVVTVTAPTAAGVAASSVNNDWRGSDTGSGLASYQQQIEQARYSGGFGGWANLGKPWGPSVTRTTVSGLDAGYTYCLRVKAVDKAGNVGYSAPRCFAVALDDRALSAGKGWRRVTGNSYYAKTATVGSAKGAVLARAAAVLDRVGVVAKTCPGCGTVGVYVGTKLIGKLSLAAASTHYRAVLLLPRFGLRTGTVTVKVLTSGRPVIVDGLVISRS